MTQAALLLLAGLPARAALYTWEPGRGYPQFVISVPADETPSQAVAHYLAALNSDPALGTVREGKTVKLPLGTFHLFSPSTASVPSPSGDKPKFAVIGNRLEHLFIKKRGTEMAVELDMVSRKLTDAGAEVYVLPVLSDIALSTSERLRFRQEIAGSFDGLLALGSNRDVTPSLYGAEVTYAKDSNLKEDESEIGLMSEFIHAEHGLFYGICKGHQLFGVSQGATMIQDIARETTSVVHHPDGEHLIEIAPDSVLAQLAGSTRITVNSYHHQAVVDPSPELGIKTVARSVEPNGAQIVEALESQSGLAVSFQFHPEYMESPLGQKIIEGMVRYARAYKSYRGTYGEISRSARKAELREMAEELR